MEDDEPPSTSTSSESPEAVPKTPPPSSSSRRKKSRRDRNMEVEETDKESQTQYCKGFFDALRVVQSTNQFKFEGGAVSPVLPTITPTNFNAITPATASDMHTIVMSILGNTPIATSTTTIPLSSPTNLLPLVTGDIQMDELSMKLLASSALPGPPIVSSSNSPDSSSTAIPQPAQIAALPLLNNLVSSTTASTSRPDKLNLTPPRHFDQLAAYNGNSDDSDGGFESRSASRAGVSKLDDVKNNVPCVEMLNWSHHNGYDEPTASSSSSGSSSSSIAANLSASYNSDSRNQNCMGGGGGGGQYGLGGGGGGSGGYGEYSPHMDPINMMSMDDQEKKKLERKRARNRQAASKCRQKKMDRIKELEDQVNHEKHRGQRLDAELVELNRALDNFRRMVERHSINGCPPSTR